MAQAFFTMPPLPTLVDGQRSSWCCSKAARTADSTHDAAPALKLAGRVGLFRALVDGVAHQDVPHQLTGESMPPNQCDEYHIWLSPVFKESLRVYKHGCLADK